MQLDEGLADDGLVIDPLLLSAWETLRLRDVRLLGLAGEISEDSTRAAVVVVTDRPLAEAAGRYFQGQLDDVLETTTELVTLNDAACDLPRLIRQWINQAAQGAGRGVQLDIDVPPGTAPIQVSVRAIDSSARELSMRLASPNEPALAALESLLGGRPVIVLDAEQSR
ncbi:MAG TPA: hypothetical protein VLL08_27045 [Kineosporiaceae bacterium]|nr:hypothetical protein [Kineosporiaceae bacterium]